VIMMVLTGKHIKALVAQQRKFWSKPIYQLLTGTPERCEGKGGGADFRERALLN
jgi:hypothetical protein